MNTISRRDFMKAAAAISLIGYLPGANAQAAPFIRHDLSTPAGQSMLATYARTVARMQARGGTDPTSWMWQWYTHFVDGTRTKSAELTRLFGSKSSVRRTLAVDMWNTCQSHAGQNPNHFLPWHRLYVHAFERIIRVVSGRPDFALPYWDYTSSDPAKRGTLPLAFRSPTHSVFKSLYRADRTTRANSGLAIHSTQPGDAMDISSALAATNYSTVGVVPGFCRIIDSGIHGRIHVLVGNSRNMGAVPYAARDPLFWVHHSNIDRMWEAWTRNGGVNPITPTWASNRFVFSDPWRRRITSALRDCYDIRTLGYDYDMLPVMPGVAATTESMFVSADGMRIQGSGVATPEHIAQATPAQLRATPVQVELTRRGKPDTAIPLDPTTRGRRAYLVLSELHAWAQPEVLYHVYLSSTPGAASVRQRHLAGTINFFDAQFHDHGGGQADEALGENFYSFDVTALLQAIARERKGPAQHRLFVTIAPGDAPISRAEPLVSRIELVFQ